METVTSDLLTEPNIAVPRLTFNRAFRAPNEMEGYANLKDGVLDVLNDAIVEDPEGMLEDIAWLEDQLSDGTPIEKRTFVAIKDGQDDDGWAAQRRYIGPIRDALSITSDGSQFEFGHTASQQEANWATVFDKTNEFDRDEIRITQAHVFETQNELRRAREAEAQRLARLQKAEAAGETLLPEADGLNTEAAVATWERLNTIAKQQRALVRLRTLALMARGPEIAIPSQAGEVPQETVVVAARQPGTLARYAGMVVRAASSLQVF